ncbi:ribosomal large subunit pseudouridine synthase B [Thermoclostridium caenicola]|uniref:Pseudouridine synthase n=2 Tax=Thermoclostridium caenicola TaxID=659425 RepID=A0A1M6KP10_9FIRM|nr:ribosomal large subunit pseudouridine synthase B [Thermoclostridium caenicola]
MFSGMDDEQMSEKMRLQKYLAKCGIASRRHAEQMIRDGRVRVNGHTVTEMGVTVSEHDLVEFDGKPVVPEEKPVYIMLNKPRGYVTTVSDPQGRKTVMDLVDDVPERVYPVGRLDYDTTGLLILTNDGDFAYHSTHPGHEVNKTYLAEVEGIPSENALKKLREGILLDGRPTSPAKVELVEQKKHSAVLRITIHEGRNRQVKRMCEAVGHPVKKLKRIAIGNLTLGDLKPGQWRYLSASDIRKIKGDKNG